MLAQSHSIGLANEETLSQSGGADPRRVSPRRLDPNGPLAQGAGF